MGCDCRREGLEVWARSSALCAAATASDSLRCIYRAWQVSKLATWKKGQAVAYNTFAKRDARVRVAPNPAVEEVVVCFSIDLGILQRCAHRSFYCASRNL